ncbi:MAG: type II toxin-antitoxin system HicA family toxin [Candidatus Pacebacteria bacterium]|nr:type II toxin-antitoxin system HicA family toxin [Candidatus Paceibacterota bacterium]NUQ57129.1 type II toxin-antitoxin system HicA family toxin [Candidatus Paceibacter sp.]
MSKLPVLTSKKLIKIIEKLGFQLDHKTGSHFIFYNQENKKRVTVPYHSKDLPKGTILSILKQAGITKDDVEKIS